MEYDLTKHKVFYELLHKFSIQAVVGIYCAIYRTNKIKLKTIVNNQKLTAELLKVYINDCWKSYHDKSDDYVVKVIDELKALQLMSHTSCIFSWIVECCLQMIKYIRAVPLPDIKDVNVIRSLLTKLLEEGAEHNLKLILAEKRIIVCSSNCKIYNYKEDEGFVI